MTDTFNVAIGFGSRCCPCGRRGALSLACHPGVGGQPDTPGPEVRIRHLQPQVARPEAEGSRAAGQLTPSLAGSAGCLLAGSGVGRLRGSAPCQERLKCGVLRSGGVMVPSVSVRQDILTSCRNPCIARTGHLRHQAATSIRTGGIPGWLQAGTPCWPVVALAACRDEIRGHMHHRGSQASSGWRANAAARSCDIDLCDPAVRQVPGSLHAQAFRFPPREVRRDRYPRHQRADHTEHDTNGRTRG
jgi:hypothetical protein